jgi:hypothetical protein
MNVNVLAFYDVCRSDKSRFPNLKRGEDEPIVGDFADNYEYVDITTHPLATVDAKSKLAALVNETLSKKAQKNADSNVTLPFDLAGLGGAEMR